MSALDVPRTISAALATEKQQTNPKGDALTMSMNQPNNVSMNGAPLQKTPATFNVFDPTTGRNWTEDLNGRRITVRQDIRGKQLVRINSMRNALGLKYLSEHNVSSMSLDSASLMIDDLIYFNNGINILRQKHADEVAMLNDTIDSILADPKVAAELAKQRQAENMKREMKDK